MMREDRNEWRAEFPTAKRIRVKEVKTGWLVEFWDFDSWNWHIRRFIIPFDQNATFPRGRRLNELIYNDESHSTQPITWGMAIAWSAVCFNRRASFKILAHDEVRELEIDWLFRLT